MKFEEWVAGGERMPLNGHQVFVRQDGPDGGLPVTMIHGFPTSSQDWGEVMPALAGAGCRVTTLDLLGFGASDKPRRHKYSLLEQADLVQALWSHLEIDRTALVAHDYGVSVAQELLARDASRISRTAWLNGGLYPDLHRPIPIQSLLHGPLGVVIGRLGSERTFRSAMRQILGRPVADDELHELWLAVSHDGGTVVQHRLLRYIDDRRANAERWTGALEAYTGPMLFIWGPADPVSGAHVVPRIRERVPQATLVVLGGDPAVGHYPQVEDPSEVARLLSAFLTSAELEQIPASTSRESQ